MTASVEPASPAHQRTVLGAPLVIDMCGFTRLMAGEGVVAAMAAVARLREVGWAAIEAEGGQLVNAFADNLFGVMPSVGAARRAAQAILSQIPASAGIGWGQLVIDGLDIWGDEMNAASRLGEDVAKCGEVLLTEAANAHG